jgi:putative ABC transport system ATP-binding protein
MDQKYQLLKIENVTKEYLLGDTLVRALDNINLQIDEGEFISILGKSGSGKSTLMHIIGLLDHPTSGRVLLKGKNVSQLKDKELARIRAETIGFIFQSFNLLSRTSSLDNVLLPTLYVKKDIHVASKSLELLRRVGLETKVTNTPSQLSGGQQQRVAIARALINNPSIILADEPTGNLDSNSSKEIISLLKELHKEGRTVVIVTHDESIAKETDRVIRIFDGKVIEDTKSQK